MPGRVRSIIRIMRSVKRSALCALLLCILPAAPLAAVVNIEIALNLYTVDVSLIPELKAPEPDGGGIPITALLFDSFILRKVFGGGFGFDVNTFLGSPAPFLDLGLHTALGGGAVFGTRVNAKAKKPCLDGDRNESFNGAGLEAAFTIGPALRFNIDERNSVTLIPAVRAKIRDNTDEVYDILADASAVLSVGYRRWLRRVGTTEIALACGADFACPFLGGLFHKSPPGSETDALELEYFYNSGFEMRLSVGCAFNFEARKTLRPRR